MCSLQRTSLWVPVKPRQDALETAQAVLWEGVLCKLRVLVKDEKTCMHMKTDPMLEEVRSSPSAAQSSLK